TCASCAGRVERKLNKIDGVTASVNYATEKAKVSYGSGVTPDQLVETVEHAGYGAVLPTPEGAKVDAATAPDEVDLMRQRLIVSSVLTVHDIAMAMILPLQFTKWQSRSLTLAAPVVVWGALHLHKAAWTNLKYGATTMDTLVS